MDRVDRVRVLVMRARRTLCALRLEELAETMRPLPVESIPGAPSSVRGVAVIRGAPTPVVDLGALLGDGAPPAPARFVTLRTGARRVALAVEEVVGVLTVDAGALSALPPLLATARADLVDAVGALDSDLLLLLRGARLLPDATLPP